MPGQPFVNGAEACGGTPCLTGSNVSDEARIFDHEEETQDLSFNVRWDITENLHTSFDFQYIKAETKNYDILVAANSVARVDYTTDSNGTPKVALSEAPNVNYASGFLANPHNYWMQFIQDHWEHNDADEKAARADVEYDLGSGGWLNSLKAGVRFADREQKVRYSSYNWAPIAPAWGCNGPGFNVDNTTPAPYPAACGNANPFNGYPAGIWESTDMSGHYDGSVFPNTPMVFLNRATLRDYDLHTEGLADRNVNAPQGWNPLCDRTANVEECYTAPEILDVREKSEAAYLMLRFGGEETKLGNINVQGNVGVRFVKTTVESHGNVGYPTAQWYNDALASGQGTCNAADNGTNQATDIQCWLTPATAGVQHRDGRGQHAREGLHQRAAELQRALRPHGHAVRALRIFEGHFASGLRPAAQLGGHQRAADRYQQQLAVSDQGRTGQRHGLQLRVRRGSRVCRPRTGRSGQLRPVVRSLSIAEHLVHPGTVLQEARKHGRLRPRRA